MQAGLSKFQVYIAGVCSLIVTAGVARFSYTPLIPIMQAETGLNDVGAGWLATANYFGYMLGVLIAASMNSLRHKYLLYQVYLLLSVVTAAAMALTTDILVWSALRFLAGVCGSGGIIIASGLILKWMFHHNHRGELGIHFAGVGISIVLTAIVVEVLVQLSAGWQQQWFAFAIVATLFAIPAWRWMPRPSAVDPNAKPTVRDSPPSPQFMITMLLAYFCAGYGFVVSVTFIVDIVEGMTSLRGWGQYIFIVVGVSAIPAVMLWDLVARRLGYLKALLLAYGIQAVGILLPALSDALWIVVIGALLYGGTFIACVSLVLTMAGHFYPSNPAKFMGKMTLAYGVAQIVAPLLTGYLTQVFGNYNLGLYLSVVVMLVGFFLILRLIKLEAKNRSRVYSGDSPKDAGGASVQP